MEENKNGLIRKGPWTEQEDVQLVLYVNLFGDRRWDFIAKVSGLKRTGKSCRLRWVNYLNPGLRRGKLTPHEERLVLELHKKWGNRWSKIAQKLPGRTDNEIKNYWRTQMRKKAQDKKKSAVMSPSSPSSSYSISSSSSTSNTNTNTITNTKERSFYDTGGLNTADAIPGETKTSLEVEESSKGYPLDNEIWQDIEFSDQQCCNLMTCQAVVSPIWDFCSIDSLWSMDEQEEENNKMLMQSISDDHFHSFPSYNHMTG